MEEVSTKQLRKRRNVLVVLLTIVLVIIGINPGFLADMEPFDDSQKQVLSDTATGTALARNVLETLVVKGRAPKTGYSRDEFGSGWASFDGCDSRNIILSRDLEEAVKADNDCTVLQGTLQDPYTGKTIFFSRGSITSSDVQIDHVVALSDAWQKGAQDLEFDIRVLIANDPLNLLAVDGPANQQKGDSDTASWLPPNKDYRCRYVARQIAVKYEYNLWVTTAEKASMGRVLNGCGEQRVPVETP